MISFFIKYRNPILITTIVIFLGSIGILGAGIVADQYGTNAVLATVGKEKIRYKDFINTYEMVRQRYIDEGKELSEEEN
ncbi:MAG: SurA N-terminal domain-containing protein, partial [Elusimicrobiaceae bacterium]|nr:SurA N-terminal domain-containing protein [Elusimicrobiaceae bacterium]